MKLVIQSERHSEILMEVIPVFEGGKVLHVCNSCNEGVAFADYEFNKYKEVPKDKVILDEVRIAAVAAEKVEAAEKALEEAKAIIDSTIAARDLVNEPANVLTPEELAKRTENLGKEFGFQVEIMHKEQIEALGMEAYLSVAKGSVNEPKLIVMRYFGDESDKENITGLVGKGLTFDTGGYSLKPSDSMFNMKNDMGGAAAVIGAMAAISKNKVKANVIAVVAACENVISGGSYKPGDIIGSMAGKHIEIMNTDAEGRLTLADAVYYAVEKENVTRIVDLATLTGAALVALGDTTTAVITNNDELYSKLQKAAEACGEKVWQLPAFEEYKELIKSSVADLRNTGGRYAGTITAGLFVGEFVKNRPWLHLDIAGTAWAEADKDYQTKGGTGGSVRTLYYFVKNN